MGAVGCAVVHAAAIDPATGAATDHAPARLTAVADVSGVVGPHWSLMRAGDTDESSTPTATDSTGLRVQYDVSDPGTWEFVVTLRLGCRARAAIRSRSATRSACNSSIASARCRPRPAASRSPTPRSPSPAARRFCATSSSTPAPPSPASCARPASASPARCGSSPTTAPTRSALAGADGSFTLAVQAPAVYTPLLHSAGDDDRAAPRRARRRAPTFVGARFDLPGGVAVAGSVVDGAAAPIAGAHVVLRAGALPSGPGLSSGAGAFSLAAEPGTYTLSFDADDWPQATLAGVVVPAGGTALAIAYTVARVAVGGSVVADDGVTPGRRRARDRHLAPARRRRHRHRRRRRGDAGGGAGGARRHHRRRRRAAGDAARARHLQI